MGAIIRKVDELGRVVISKDIRNKLGINYGDSLEMDERNGVISLKKVVSACVFCGTSDNLRSYKDVVVCEECIKNMNRLL